jgi:hypothetical protein
MELNILTRRVKPIVTLNQLFDVFQCQTLNVRQSAFDRLFALRFQLCVVQIQMGDRSICGSSFCWMYLKGFGWVKLFCQNFKDEVRHYILFRPEMIRLLSLERQSFKQVHDDHWKIETFHRVIKQVCN